MREAGARVAHRVRRRFRSEHLGRALARGEPERRQAPRASPGEGGVRIVAVETVGNYAVRIAFDDGHDTGIYSWRLLRTLAAEQPPPAC